MESDQLALSNLKNSIMVMKQEKQIVLQDLQQDRMDLSRLLMAQSKLNLQYMQQKRQTEAKKEKLKNLDRMLGQSIDSLQKIKETTQRLSQALDHETTVIRDKYYKLQAENPYSYQKQFD
ncbi:hypothetical protein ABPG72_014857 [Tetrahymena utriculariae]